MSEMAIDEHSFDRMAVRLTDEEKATVLRLLKTKWNRLENNTLHDYAIVVMQLSHLRRTSNTDWESNGDAVVGIVRKGVLKTVMLRRMVNQPMTAEALRVDKVKWAIPMPLEAKKMLRRVNNNGRNGRNTGRW